MKQNHSFHNCQFLQKEVAENRGAHDAKHMYTKMVLFGFEHPKLEATTPCNKNGFMWSSKLIGTDAHGFQLVPRFCLYRLIDTPNTQTNPRKKWYLLST